MTTPAPHAALHFAPHILFLSQAPDAVARGLRGEPVTLDQASPLRNDVSTDEITPLPILTHYDDVLGRYPYTGFKAGDALPIGADAIRGAGIEVVVAGKRYGKGSSREHSPTAESWRACASSSPKASNVCTGRTPTTSACSRRPTSA